MVTALMVANAIVAVLLIAAVVLQSGKSAGMGGSIDGGAEAIFGDRVKGLDVLLAKLTMVLAVIFAVINLVLAKFTVI